MVIVKCLLIFDADFGIGVEDFNVEFRSPGDDFGALPRRHGVGDLRGVGPVVHHQ